MTKTSSKKAKAGTEIPAEIKRIRDIALRAISPLEPAGAPMSDVEAWGLMLGSRTNGGRDLPPYYLVYFLLVDLLGFQNIGQSEKVAWAVPVRYCGRLYAIEHRKMGVGIFAPTLDRNARISSPPSEEAESDASEICKLIKKGVAVATHYFELRAEQAASGNRLNVINQSSWLFERYQFFRDHFRKLTEKAETQRTDSHNKTFEDATKAISSWYSLRREAKWNAQAAVEAFFSWTEHVFIHLAILQGKVKTGADVASLAEAEWKTKFKCALDIGDSATKAHYDNLLDLRTQIRNFMAHGAFGKRGEAFSFHSGAGAVPILLTGREHHRYSLTGMVEFDEQSALAEIEEFIEHLWSGNRSPARYYIFSTLPSILTLVEDGSYAGAMQSEEEMIEFVDGLTARFDIAANMDW